MFAAAFNRPASAGDLARMRALVDSLAERHAVAGSGALSSVAVWKDMAHTFFNMKEFLYLLRSNRVEARCPGSSANRHALVMLQTAPNGFAISRSRRSWATGRTPDVRILVAAHFPPKARNAVFCPAPGVYPYDSFDPKPGRRLDGKPAKLVPCGAEAEVAEAAGSSGMYGNIGLPVSEPFPTYLGGGRPHGQIRPMNGVRCTRANVFYPGRNWRLSEPGSGSLRFGSENRNRPVPSAESRGQSARGMENSPTGSCPPTQAMGVRAKYAGGKLRRR
jgi:hypothetical protein